MPVLRIINSIFNMIGSGRVTAIDKVFKFVMAHSDVIFGILRDRPQVITPSTLTEVVLVTSIIRNLSSRPGSFETHVRIIIIIIISLVFFFLSFFLFFFFLFIFAHGMVVCLFVCLFVCFCFCLFFLVARTAKQN